MTKLVNIIKRESSPYWRTKPTVFLAGFQKSGTTSLYNYLLGSNVFMPGKVKENNELAKPIYNIKDYLMNFPPKWKTLGKQTLCGSHQIGFVPYGAQRIKDLFPESKVLFIARNPVDRAISRYLHNQRKKNAILDKKIPFEFEKVVDFELDLLESVDIYDHKSLYEVASYCNSYGLVIARGIYATYLKTYSKLDLPVYVVFLENLVDDYEKEMKKIFDFLEVSDYRIPAPHVFNKKNSSFNCDVSVIEKLQEFFKEPNLRLSELLDTPLPWT